MLKKYQAIDIANYILWYANRNGRDSGITSLKLQKIIYYVAAKCLKERGEVLFDEKIEKWRYGPVTPSIYHTFKERGHGTITEPTPRFEARGSETIVIDFDPADIDKSDVEIINPVIDKLIDYSAFELVDMTHREEAWSNEKDTILNTWDNPSYSNEELKRAVNSISS